MIRSSRPLFLAGFLLLHVVCTLGGAGAGVPLNVLVTLRGKKYEVKDATSVADVQNSVEEQAGLSKEQQSVLFKGNLLRPELDLEEAGVADGDTVNIVPSKKPKTSPPATDKVFAVNADGEEEEAEGELEEASSAGAAGAGADPFGFGGLGGMGGMGGMGMPGMGGMMPPGVSPEQYRKMMKEMINSNMMEEVLGNPEKMEQARQAILENPTLKQAMSQLPGFTEMIDSPEKWREQMELALDMFRAQKAMMQTQGSEEDGDADAADVDDLDDD